MPQLTWLVTGCTSGLGEQFIQSILARGDKAIATCRGDVSRISKLADSGAKTYSLDVTASQTEINAVVQKVLEDNDQVDVLVNNAGFIQAGLAEENTYEDYLAQFETNFFGVVKMTNAILPHFRSRKSGTIVTLGSVGGIAGSLGAAPYCSSKFALEGWHDCLRQELLPLSINSIIFEPGVFRSEVFSPSNLKFAGKKKVSEYDGMRGLLEGYVSQTHGNQPGDAKKAVEIMLDVVKKEGVAEGKTVPDRLALGKDGLTAVRERYVAGLAICDEWEDVVTNTDIE